MAGKEIDARKSAGQGGGVHQAEAFGGDGLAKEVAAVLAGATAVPGVESLAEELGFVETACRRGYFLPDEDEVIRLRYSQYLSLRSALLVSMESLAEKAGEGGLEWRLRLPLFVTAFAAAWVLMRAGRFIVNLAKDRPVVWKKLDEEDVVSGIPGKTFSALFKSVTAARNRRRFIAAADFYFANRAAISEFADDPVLGKVVALLAAEEPLIERSRAEALKRLFAYRWFSILRRHRSAWRHVMFGLFKASGSTIAELRRPGLKPAGSPKRIDPEMRSAILAKARPGDVIVTRHDDAMSNLFLPGFWPHAALYLGTAADLEALGVEIVSENRDIRRFLEAKKDGVRIRAAEETLHVDACVILRSPLSGEPLAEAIRRALSHAGKPYDFLFDFRTQDVLACTEVIYRGFHGIAPVKFHLEEVGGRLCLPAEELLNQAMDCGFRVVAAAGLGGGKVLTGTRAEIAFHGSRQPL